MRDLFFFLEQDFTNFEPLWLLVLLLFTIIVSLPNFQRIRFLEVGKPLIISEIQTIIDLTLWIDAKGNSIKLSQVQAKGFYAEKIDDQHILVSGLTPQENASLTLYANDNTFNFNVKYGLFANTIYLIQNNERYFRYKKDRHALIEDVLLGYYFTLKDTYHNDREYFNILLSIENNVRSWYKQTKSGGLIRKSADSHNLPVGLIKYFAAVGKENRLQENINLVDFISRVTDYQISNILAKYKITGNDHIPTNTLDETTVIGIFDKIFTIDVDKIEASEASAHKTSH